MRTFVITGAASGIGKATAELLTSRGDRVIGVDLAGADIDADLASGAGRASLLDRVTALASGSGVDAVIAVAGVALPSSLTVRVNYFGAVETMTGLRSLLDHSATPRGAVVASFSSVQNCDPELLGMLRAGDENAAVRRADELAASGHGHLIYPSTKRAIVEWVREASITKEWAGAGIPLNAVGPGIILTPMTAPLLETEEGREQLNTVVPMPLHGPAEPVVIARALAWVAGVENTHMAGQVLFVDGGAEVTMRGARVFGD